MYSVTVTVHTHTHTQCHNWSGNAHWKKGNGIINHSRMKPQLMTIICANEWTAYCRRMNKTYLGSIYACAHIKIYIEYLARSLFAYIIIYYCHWILWIKWVLFTAIGNIQPSNEQCWRDSWFNRLNLAMMFDLCVCVIRHVEKIEFNYLAKWDIDQILKANHR